MLSDILRNASPYKHFSLQNKMHLFFTAYTRNPLTLQEKAALLETFAGKELPSQTALQSYVSRNQLLAGRTYKQCRNFLDKQKRKVSRSSVVLCIGPMSLILNHFS